MTWHSQGWQDNPIPFDSVFNYTSSYAWGSPDIVPMFRKGLAASANYTLETYSADVQDFSTFGAGMLDDWVFNRVESALPRLSDDDVSIIFFLHLLGTDMTGHSRG